MRSRQLSPHSMFSLSKKSEMDSPVIIWYREETLWPSRRCVRLQHRHRGGHLRQKPWEVLICAPR